MNFIIIILNIRSLSIKLFKLALFGKIVIIKAILFLLSLFVLANIITMILTNRNFNIWFFEITNAILYQYYL